MPNSAIPLLKAHLLQTVVRSVVFVGNLGEIIYLAGRAR